MFFNFTCIDENELNYYLQDKFVDNPKFETARNVYTVLFIVCSIFTLVSLLMYFKIRNSYIVRQRNFPLTFSCGIFAAIDLLTSFFSQITYVHCLALVFSANILNAVVNLLFLSRSLRVILFYHLNFFKVSTFSKNSKDPLINNNLEQPIEPNNFLLVISRKIDKIIATIIIVPTLIAIIVTLAIYVSDENVREECPIFERQDALIVLKQSKAAKLYSVVIVYSTMFMILNFVISIFLLFVKDVNKYGVKFECLSVSLMVLFIDIINFIIQKQCSIDTSVSSFKKYPMRGYLEFFERTKGGKMLFSIVLFYMFFVCITLPCIHYYKAKRTKVDYFQDPLSSLHYFQRVLENPSLINELREIAIGEFSVENVLFWESYRVLRKMVYRYLEEYRRAQEMGDLTLLKQYDFRGYYIQQLQHESESSLDGESYDPNMPVPKELLPYYISFYQMFISYKGPSVVNISGDVVKRIFSEICVYPTVGIFDEAKDEIVSMMYSSIYPILLNKNKKYMSNLLS